MFKVRAKFNLLVVMLKCYMTVVMPRSTFHMTVVMPRSTFHMRLRPCLYFCFLKCMKRVNPPCFNRDFLF
jgi:hypothetical protein